MNESSLPPSNPGLLAGHLAELVSRLRQSLPVEPPRSVPPSCLTRLRVSSRLLAAFGAEKGTSTPADLALAVAELADLLEQAPELLPWYYDRPLVELAAFLESLLALADGGASWEELLRDRRWPLVQAGLLSSGTPLALLVEWESGLLHWQAEWGAEPLDRGRAAALRSRWRDLRSRADAVFGTGPSF